MPVIVPLAEEPNWKLIAVIGSVLATFVIILLYENFFACLIACGFYHLMRLPRRRFKGETTEIDVLRFDADLEL